MAFAKINMVTTKNVNLDLTMAEAQVLADIFSSIGGSPVNSRRAITDSISHALIVAGIMYDDNAVDPNDGDLIGSITFKDLPGGEK